MTKLVAVAPVTSWWHEPADLLELQVEWRWQMTCGDVSVLRWLEELDDVWQLRELVAVPPVTSPWYPQRLRVVVKRRSKCPLAAVKPVTSGFAAKCWHRVVFCKNCV